MTFNSFVIPGYVQDVIPGYDPESRWRPRCRGSYPLSSKLQVAIVLKAAMTFIRARHDVYWNLAVNLSPSFGDTSLGFFVLPSVHPMNMLVPEGTASRSISFPAKNLPV